MLLDNQARAGILLALLAAASMAATGFVANELVDDGAPGLVVGSYETLFGLACVVSINLLLRRRATRPPLARWVFPTRWVLLASVAYAAALGSFYTALSSVDYSLAAPILGATPLVSYAAALVILPGRERITRRALAGASLIAAGVGLIGVTA